MKNKLDKIEILAPAGSIDRMKAAFSAGADACYIGGSKFGARAFADNPNEADLVDAIHYAHFHKKKLFLTLNTLLKEEEIQKELYDYVLPYYEAGIDAVIVQDFGVMRFLGREFPDLPLHASTQMTLCDSTVFHELKKYPLERLVLSRELSLAEIASFKETGLEIECFVHGALCVCYSGQCSMSYFNGGRSGNRGSCAGPCRVDYNIYGEKKGKPLKGEAYLLSPKDMCSIDFIPEMFDAGVYSLKIEGRMKRPEYAALTSYLYRKWADFFLENGKEAFHGKEAVKDRRQDVKKLSDLYNRGSFTGGYLFSHNGKDMMADKRPNHNGIYVGKVTKVGNQLKKNVMRIEALEELNAQDVVEIRAESEVNPIYEFTLKDGIKAHTDFFANFTSGLKIKEGMHVYRTKNDKLLKSIESDFIKAGLKRPLSAFVKAKVGEALAITLTSSETVVTVFGSTVEEAKSKPITAERIKEAICKLGDTDFTCTDSDVEVEISGGIFLPMSQFNDLRRKAIVRLTEKIRDSFKRERKERPKTLSVHPVSKKIPKYQLLVSCTTQVEQLLSEANFKSTVVELVFNMDLFPRGGLKTSVLSCFERGVNTYLRLPEIFRNEISRKYEDYFASPSGKEVLRLISGFIVRNLEELVFVKRIAAEYGKDFVIISDTNLHVFNSFSASALYEMGVHSYTVSLEHTVEEARQVRTGLTVPIEVSMILYGREELMVTTQCQWKNKYKCVKELSKNEAKLPDILYLEQKRKGKNGEKALFPVGKNCESCNNYIYMELPLNYLGRENVIEKINPEIFRLDFTFESKEEISEVLNLAKLSK